METDVFVFRLAALSPLCPNCMEKRNNSGGREVTYISIASIPKHESGVNIGEKNSTSGGESKGSRAAVREGKMRGNTETHVH